MQSPITEKDIKAIEKGLHYQLPKPYANFLRRWCLQEYLTIPVRFCGDYANCYEPAQEEDPFATVQMEWDTASRGSASGYLAHIRQTDMPLGETRDSFLDAGFLKVAKFEGYFVFLNLVTGEVVHIYHEEIYDMSVEYGVDVTNYHKVQPCTVQGFL